METTKRSEKISNYLRAGIMLGIWGILAVLIVLTICLCEKDFSPHVMCETATKPSGMITLTQQDTTDTNGTKGKIVRYNLLEPGEAAKCELVIWSDCSENEEPVVKRITTSLKKEEKVEQVVKEIEPGTTPAKDAVETVQPVLEGKLSISNTVSTEDATAKLLDYNTSVYYQQAKGLSLDTSSYCFSYFDENNKLVNLSLTSMLDGENIRFGLTKESNDQVENIFLNNATVPLDLTAMPTQEFTYIHDYWKKTIDEAVRRKGKTQIWTGVGLVGGSIVSTIFLHRQTTPVLQTENGLDYFDKANPFYDDNILARKNRRIQYGWEYLNYAAAATGSYLIWRGHKNLKCSVGLSLNSATFKWKLSQ